MTSDGGGERLAMTTCWTGSRTAGAGGRTHLEIIRLAVQLGCDDIRAAYELGRNNKSLLKDAVFLRVRVQAKAPALPLPNKYAPEQVMPRLSDAPDADAANGVQEWKALNFRTLLKQHVRTSAKGQTVEQAIKDSANPGGTIHENLEDTANSLPESQDTLHPRQAFIDGVITPLSIDPAEFLHKILQDS
jgi:hypothetical protein